MFDNTTNSVLERIANALERLAPPDKKINNLDHSEGFIFESKSGLIGMSKSLALEYGKKNIKINCISPGFIKSEMTDKISESFKQTLESKISLDRFGDPEDVANAVIFLSSNLADYITGETIHVNGGMYFS